MIDQTSLLHSSIHQYL